MRIDSKLHVCFHHRRQREHQGYGDHDVPPNWLDSFDDLTHCCYGITNLAGYITHDTLSSGQQFLANFGSTPNVERMNK